MSVMLCCPSCRAWMSVPVTLSGQLVKCPACGAHVQAPATEPAAGASAPVVAPGPPAEEEIVLRVVEPGEEGLEVLEENGGAPAPPPRKPRRPRGQGDVPRSTASPRLRAALADQLERGETIVWCGQPSHEPALIRALFVLIPGGLVLLAGLIWLLVGLIKIGSKDFSGVDICFPFFLIAAAAGLGVLGFHWLWTPLHTCYALTNRRALVWRQGWLGGTGLEEYAAAELGEMTCREGPGGRGDVIFRSVHETYSYTQGNEVRTAVRTSEYGFTGIERAGAVEKLIRDTLRVQPS